MGLWESLQALFVELIRPGLIFVVLGLVIYLLYWAFIREG